MSVNTFVFDFGGVLFDWNPRYLYQKVFRDAEKLEYFLKTVCPMSWHSQLDAGRTFEEAIAERKALFPQYAREIDMYHYAARFDEMFAEPFYQTHEILKKLSEKYDIYGLTNWPNQHLERFKKKYDVFEHMKGIVVSSVEKVMKPDAKLYEILMQRYGLKPENLLFIDDNPPNVAAAEALGWSGIRFENPKQLQTALENRGFL